MTTTYGITSTGFVTKTVDVLVTQMTTSVQQAIGVLPVGAVLIIIQIFAAIIAELWELMEAVYNSQDPNAATGAAQDALNAITGTDRLPATPSVATVSLTGTPATVVSIAATVLVPTILTQFSTTAAATIVAATAWVVSTTYNIGDRRTSSGNIYVCTAAGVSANAPSGTSATPVVDPGSGTLAWLYMGAGTGVVDVTANCSVTGPTVAQAGTITQIGNPVVGWSGVYNLLDAVLGSNIETDGAYRLRRESEIALDGTGTSAAIAAQILAVTGVSSVTVFVNDTDTTDGSGLPPHQVECLVEGGADLDVATAILNNVAAGIVTHGTTTAFPIDNEGVSQTISFSRPTIVPIYVSMTVNVDTTFPADGVTEIQNAIVALNNGLPCGYNVVAARLISNTFTITGVDDVPFATCFIGLSASPSSSATLVIAARSLAQFDSSRISITTVLVTP